MDNLLSQVNSVNLTEQTAEFQHLEMGWATAMERQVQPYCCMPPQLPHVFYTTAPCILTSFPALFQGGSWKSVEQYCYKQAFNSLSLFDRFEFFILLVYHTCRHTHTRTYTHLHNLCSAKLWYSLCPCILSSNVYDPFSKACTGIWWSVSFQVCIETCNLTVWVMLPMDSLPTDSLSSSILCPFPTDKNDWWSPLLIYQITDLLWHRLLTKLALSKICSGHQGGIGLKHLAFRFFFSIDFFCGKLFHCVQHNLTDPYSCDKKTSVLQ